MIFGETNPGCSSGGQTLKRKLLKAQGGSWEKTLMLAGGEDGWRRRRWLDRVSDATDMASGPSEGGAPWRLGSNEGAFVAPQGRGWC